MYSETCRLWVMRRWRCSPVRVGIEYKQLYTYHFIVNGMFLQFVFKLSAQCLIACLISLQQRSANRPSSRSSLSNPLLFLPSEKKKKRGVKSGATYCYDRWHKSLYHLRTLIDGQLVPVHCALTLIHTQNSGTTCLRVYVPSQKIILSAWPIIPLILSVRSCYTL